MTLLAAVLAIGAGVVIGFVAGVFWAFYVQGEALAAQHASLDRIDAHFTATEAALQP